MENEFKQGALVLHRNITFLAKVENEDPRDSKKVIIKPFDSDKSWACPKRDLQVLG